MSSLNLSDKSYILTNETIDKEIGINKIGNYALGIMGQNNIIPKYVGRSDNDLNKRLKDHVLEKKYTNFKYSLKTSSMAAFKKECENYHDFKEQLDNDVHPRRPDNTDWKCPRCNAFESGPLDYIK